MLEELEAELLDELTPAEVLLAELVLAAAVLVELELAEDDDDEL